MVSRLLVTSAMAVSLLVAGQAQAQTSADDCWRVEEVKAARILHLQNMLLVDALKCRDTMPSTMESYNGFMSKQHGTVVSSKHVTQARFVRMLGAEAGDKASTDYDTQIGNQLSAAPIDVQRCETSGMYARLATVASEADLVQLADLLAASVHVVPCAVADAAPAKPTHMVIEVWKRPEPAVMAAPVAVSTASAAPAPAAGAALAPAAGAAPAIVAASAVVSPATGVVAVAPMPAMVSTPAVAVQAAAVAPIAIAAVKAPVVAPAAVPDRSQAVKALQAAVAALNDVAQSLAQEAPKDIAASVN